MIVQLNKDSIIMESFSIDEKLAMEKQAKMAELARDEASKKLEDAELAYDQADDQYETASDAIPEELNSTDMYQAGALGALGALGVGGMAYGVNKRKVIADKAKTYAAGTRPFRYAADVVKNYGQPIPPVK